MSGKTTITNTANSPLFHTAIMIERSFDGSFSDEFGRYSLTPELEGNNLIQQYSYFSDRIPLIQDNEKTFNVKIPLLKQV